MSTTSTGSGPAEPLTFACTSVVVRQLIQLAEATGLQYADAATLVFAPAILRQKAALTEHWKQTASPRLPRERGEDFGTLDLRHRFLRRNLTVAQGARSAVPLPGDEPFPFQGEVPLDATLSALLHDTATVTGTEPTALVLQCSAEAAAGYRDIVGQRRAAIRAHAESQAAGHPWWTMAAAAPVERRLTAVPPASPAPAQ